jgi:hypothetical protein
MTDRHDELAGGLVVVNAVDHAASAERKAHACVVPRAARHRISQIQKPILFEYQTMGGCFWHERILACFSRDGYINRL